MNKSEFNRRINKILNEEETFLLSLLLLAQMHNDEKYKNISDLLFLFDNYNGFKKFIKYYEGQTIHVPTSLELKQALRLLDLFQKVKIDKLDFDTYYSKLKLSTLGLTKDYCRNEIERFYNMLHDEGNITLNKIRKLGK